MIKINTINVNEVQDCVQQDSTVPPSPHRPTPPFVGNVGGIHIDTIKHITIPECQHSSQN